MRLRTACLTLGLFVLAGSYLRSTRRASANLVGVRVWITTSAQVTGYCACPLCRPLVQRAGVDENDAYAAGTVLVSFRAPAGDTLDILGVGVFNRVMRTSTGLDVAVRLPDHPSVLLWGTQRRQVSMRQRVAPSQSAK